MGTERYGFILAKRVIQDGAGNIRIMWTYCINPEVIIRNYDSVVPVKTTSAPPEVIMSIKSFCLTKEEMIMNILLVVPDANIFEYVGSGNTSNGQSPVPLNIFGALEDWNKRADLKVLVFDGKVVDEEA